MELLVMERLLNAIEFAARYHGDQKRKESGDPYITHPIRVARRLLTWGYSSLPLLTAAILHDVVEDTPCTIEEIRQKFGPDVARWVEEVTDDRTLSQIERKRYQLDHINEKSDQARLIKAADMSDNLHDLLESKKPIEEIQGYFAWKEAIWRNGIQGIDSNIDSEFGLLWKETIIRDGRKYHVIPSDFTLSEYWQYLKKQESA